MRETRGTCGEGGSRVHPHSGGYIIGFYDLYKGSGGGGWSGVGVRMFLFFQSVSAGHI